MVGLAAFASCHLEFHLLVLVQDQHCAHIVQFNRSSRSTVPAPPCVVTGCLLYSCVGEVWCFGKER